MYKCTINTKSQITFLLLLTLSCKSVFALNIGWYLGAGYGVSRLDPKIPFNILSVSKAQSNLTKLVMGYDLNQITSVETAISDLGQAKLENNDVVDYASADVVGIFRLYDHRERNTRSIWDFNLFAKLGLGYLKLESDTSLESGSRIHMLAGIGAEIELFSGFALRTDLEFIDSDAAAASISLVKRFRYSQERTPIVRPTTPTAEVPATLSQNVTEQSDSASEVPVRAVDPPVEAPVKEITPIKKTGKAEDIDKDKDGVADHIDQCENSRSHYPVRADGCTLLDGVIRDLQFAKYSSELTAQGESILHGLAKIFKQYPLAKFQMSSHTANDRTDTEQIDLTRNRLRSIALYLRKLNVIEGQIKFMAFGATVKNFRVKQPDRIEIKELP